ncbi:baseplate assembly protein [Vibrio proteolyticus]
MSTTIELSSLPKPKVKQDLDFETELAGKKAQLKALYPQWDADVESDPTVANLEVSAYSALNERQRVNDAALSVMLPWSMGEDLDNLAAFFNLKRELIQPGDDTVTPPIEPIYESDESLRRRCLLAWSGISTAGPRKSYIFHALSASALVKDAYAYRVRGGEIALVVLSHTGNGEADASLMATVDAHINQEDVRPLCCDGTVKSALIHEYQITAVLDIANTAAKESILAMARSNTEAYTDRQHRIGALVSTSALDAAMHLEGVRDVDLQGFVNYQADQDTAPYCTGIVITAKGDV